MDSVSQPLLSICMIVRDESERIGPFLRRHAPLADEILVVDTGSADDTVQVARNAGARIERFEWCDDFAAARNYSLDRARGRWILILDPDEWIEETDFKRVKQRCEEPSIRIAYSMVTLNYSNNSSLIDWVARPESLGATHGYYGFYPSTKARLFPRDSTIRFEGEIHEIVEPALAAAGYGILSLDVPVHHLHERREQPAQARVRLERYLRLSRLKAQRYPDDPKALYELGMIAFEAGEFGEATRVLDRAMSQAPGDEAIRLLNAAVRLRLRDYVKVLALLPSDHPLMARFAPACAIAAEALAGLDNTEKAMAMLIRALDINPSYPHAMVLLGNLLMSAGRMSEASVLFQKAVQLDPGNEISHTNAGIVLAALGRMKEARLMLEAAVRLDSLQWLPLFYLGQIDRAEGRIGDARRHLGRALGLDPQNERIRQALNGL